MGLLKKPNSGLKSPPVQAIILQAKAVSQNLTLTGSFIPNESTEIKTEISGRLVGLYFTEGQVVQEGALLLKLDDREYQLEEKRLNLKLDLAQIDLKRKKELLAIKATSQAEIDIAENTVATLQAELQAVALKKSYTEVRAPFTGTIGLRRVSIGSYLTPATVITTIQQLKPLKIEFQLPEQYAHDVQTGSIVEYTTGNLSGNGPAFQARVYAAEPGVSPDSRSLNVRALCLGYPATAKPGEFIRVNLLQQLKASGLFAPAEAVIPDVAGNKVFISRNGRVESIPVQTGIRTHTAVEISSEQLHPGDTLITTGLLALKPGKPVRVEVTAFAI